MILYWRVRRHAPLFLVLWKQGYVYRCALCGRSGIEVTETGGMNMELREYQAQAGLVADGLRGPMTMASQVADERAKHIAELSSYRGSFGLLVRCEGHRGVPYVPESSATSGVTLGFGWDLAHQSAADLWRIWNGLWHPVSRFEELEGCLGLKGEKARRWLQSHGAGRWWFTQHDAAERLPHQAAPYWLAALREWPALADAPALAQTVLMSVVYSSWTAPVRYVALAFGPAVDWQEAADRLAQTGDTPRRKLEADLLRTVKP